MAKCVILPPNITAIFRALHVTTGYYRVKQCINDCSQGLQHARQPFSMASSSSSWSSPSLLWSSSSLSSFSSGSNKSFFSLGANSRVVRFSFEVVILPQEPSFGTSLWKSVARNQYVYHHLEGTPWTNASPNMLTGGKCFNISTIGDVRAPKNKWHEKDSLQVMISSYLFCNYSVSMYPLPPHFTSCCCLDCFNVHLPKGLRLGDRPTISCAEH